MPLSEKHCRSEQFWDVNRCERLYRPTATYKCMLILKKYFTQFSGVSEINVLQNAYFSTKIYCVFLYLMQNLEFVQSFYNYFLF